MTIKCSLCPQTFEEDDPLFEIRKKRHAEGRHTKHYIVSQRDSSKINNSMGGLVIGEVEWIEV